MIGDGGSCSIKLRIINCERFVVRPRAILQHTQRDLFAQENRPVGRAPEVNPGMYAVAERDVISKFVQLTRVLASGPL